VDELKEAFKSLKIALRSKENKVLQSAKDIEQTSAKHEQQIRNLTNKLQQLNKEKETLLFDDNAKHRYLQARFNKQLEVLFRDAYRLGRGAKGDKIQGIDQLVRKHMQAVNPVANPWKTLRDLGDEVKIQEALSQKYDEGKQSVERNRGMRR